MKMLFIRKLKITKILIN